MQTLSKKGFQDNDIQKLTGHKNVASLQSYKQPDLQQQRELSNAISETVAPQPEASHEPVQAEAYAGNDPWDMDIDDSTLNDCLQSAMTLANTSSGNPCADNTTCTALQTTTVSHNQRALSLPYQHVPMTPLPSPGFLSGCTFNAPVTLNINTGTH